MNSPSSPSMRKRKVTLALTTAWRRMVSLIPIGGMLMEGKDFEIGAPL